MGDRLGDEGEIDLLDFFAELTIYTSSACLIGHKFRAELDGRFAELYHDLEQGTDAIAYVDAYAPIESFRRRDAARLGLVELVQAIMDRRASGPPATEDDRDLLDVLMSVRTEAGEPRFSADEVTGMFISMMFAGHHTTSGTAAWTLIELLRHPDLLAGVRSELDELCSRRGRGELPGAARDAAARVGDERGAAAAPPAHLAAAGGQDRPRGRGLPDPSRRVRRRVAGDLEPDLGGLRRARPLRPRALPRRPGGGPGEPVDVDPLRRRAPSLRRRPVRASCS